MHGFELDAHDPRAGRPHPARRAELRELVLREAADRARRYDVELLVQDARDPSQLAMFWFQGDRVRVLRAVGGWEPGAGIDLQIAHAMRLRGHYELALYAIIGATAGRRAA